MTPRRPRFTAALALASALMLLTACSETGETGGASGDNGTAGASTVTVVHQPLPESPPSGLCASTNVVSKADYKHPHLGEMRLFTVVDPSTKNGCVVAVAADVSVQPIVAISSIGVYGTELKLANPVSDSTGNAFVTYNPGRYDGVLVLVPTETGFEHIDPELSSGYDNVGRRNFYNANLTRPDSKGQYQIEYRHHDCTPSCAGGTTTTQTLSWNGSNYLAP